MLARCPELEKGFYTALRESFGSNARDGVHASGLLQPRKEYWNRAVPKPATDEELGYWTAGRGHEDALSRFLQDDFGPTPQAVIDGISMRPDFVSLTGRIIPAGAYAEMKTRRSNLPENDQEAQEKFGSYREQMRIYMALRRRMEMYLIVLSLVEGKTQDALSRSSPVWAVYRETFADVAELEAERAKWLARRDGFLTLLEAQASGVQQFIDAALLATPLCADWLCGKATPEMTRKPLCQTCGKEFATAEFGPEKHLASKTGAGHVITPAEVTWSYVPRCKWYAECRPWLVDPSRGVR